jgi:hypothetical protein
MLHSNLALFQAPVAGVEGVFLHATLLTTIELTLLRNPGKIHWVHIPKVSTHHTSITQPSQAPRIRARQVSSVQLCADHLKDQGLGLQQFLAYHCLLVDVMNICQVMAKRACLQLLPTLVALNVVRVPFACCDPPRLHPAVGL